MATNPRQHNRLSSYTGFSNPPPSSQSNLRETIFPGGFQTPGSWTSSSFSDTRPSNTPRDPANAFAPGASGPGPRTATGDHDNWNPSPWNNANTTQARNLSGNTSPRSRPDTFPHSTDPMGNSLLNGSSMNQRAPGSQPSTTSAAEPSNDALRPPPGFGNPAAETYTDQSAQGLESRFSGVYSGSQRFGQDPSSLSAVGSGPRRSISALPEANLTTQASGPLSDFAFGTPAATGLHSQRASITGSLPAHQSMGFDQNAAREQTQMTDGLAGLTLEDIANNAMNPSTMDKALAYNNEARNIPSNSVSHAWESAAGHSNGFLNEPYLAGGRRGSAVDRNSPPTGNAYRTAGILQSPKSRAGTLQANAHAWPRRESVENRSIGEYMRLLQQAAQQKQQQQLQQQQQEQLQQEQIQQQQLQQQQFQQQQLQQQLQQQPFFANHQFPQTYPQYPPGYSIINTQDPAMHVATYGTMSSYGFAGHQTHSPTPSRSFKDQDPGKAYRSPLLLEFKETQKSRSWELRDIWGHVVEFSGDQQASRFIQHKLESANSDERDRVFAEIRTNAVQLMKDVFGNYVMQKLVEYGDQVQKKVLADAMKGKLVDLSLQTYACRVVQKALKHVLVEQQAELVQELKADVMKLALDQHGNHVIQQAIMLVPREHIECLMAGIKANVYDLSIHQFGCRVLQRAMEYGNEEDKAVITAELHKYTGELVTNMFGNYVVQHVLENGRPEDRDKMFKVVMGDLLRLSKHKNASNVVEKCISLSTPEEQRRIRNQLVGNETNNTLFAMMKDQFGNYVIQKLVKTLQGDDKTEVVNKLVAHLQSLKRSGATSKQIDAMERLINESRRPSTATSNNHTPASTPPTSPGGNVGTTSAVPTPNLTMDSNSPLSTPSSSPTSMNGDATGPIKGPRVRKAAGKAY